MRNLLRVSVILLWLAAMSGIAAEIGAPPGRTWTYRQLRVGEEFPDLPFVWMVQRPDGLLYLSDQRGVLEYDGAN